MAGFIPFSDLVTADRAAFEVHLNYPLAAVAVTVGLIGIILAYVFYKKENDLSTRFAKAMGGFYRWAYHKFYIDEVYLFVTKKRYCLK